MATRPGAAQETPGGAMVRRDPTAMRTSTRRRAPKSATTGEPLEVQEFCRHCWPAVQSNIRCPQLDCMKKKHSYDNPIVTVLWPRDGRSQKWVEKDFDFSHLQYLACGYGRECKYGRDCTRAHSSPAGAEIAFWSWLQPLRSQEGEGGSRRHRDPGIYCHVCHVVMNSDTQMEQHRSGSKHKAMCAAYARVKDLPAPAGLVLLPEPLHGPSGAAGALELLPGGGSAVVDAQQPMHTIPPGPPSAASSSSLSSADEALAAFELGLARQCDAASPSASWAALSESDECDVFQRQIQEATWALDLKEGLVVPCPPSPPVSEAAFQAVCGGHVESLRALLNSGEVRPNARWRDCPVLLWAVVSRSCTALQLLIDAGAAVNSEDQDGQAAVHIAASLPPGDTGELDLLIKHGCNVNSRDHRGRTALHHASNGDNPAAVRKLIAARARPNSKSACGFTALDIALRRCSAATSSPSAEECRNELRAWNGWPQVLPAGMTAKPLQSLPTEVSVLPFYAEAEDQNVPLSEIVPDTIGIAGLSEIEERFRPLFVALSHFPHEDSVELSRLSVHLKPVLQRLRLKCKAKDKGYVTVRQSPNKKQHYVALAADYTYLLAAIPAPPEPQRPPGQPSRRQRAQLSARQGGPSHLYAGQGPAPRGHSTRNYARFDRRRPARPNSVAHAPRAMPPQPSRPSPPGAIPFAMAAPFPPDQIFFADTLVPLSQPRLPSDGAIFNPIGAYVST